MTFHQSHVINKIRFYKMARAMFFMSPDYLSVAWVGCVKF